MKKKIYFYASEFIDKNTGRKSLVFCGQNWMRWHWAGWGPDKVNFVLAKLVAKRWTKKGIQIYQAFNDALLEVSKEKQENRNFPKWVLVMFQKDQDENWVWQVESNGNQVDENLHGSESGLQTSWEGKEETTSTT